MSLTPGERAANPAHKYPQPDFSTLWWWKDAWSPQTMEWFLSGDVSRRVLKLSILTHYNTVNPGDATGKSLPPAEWLTEYLTRLGEITYVDSKEVFRPSGVDWNADPCVSPSILLACYYIERVRTLAVGGYDYHTSSRISLLLRTTRLSEADWRHLHSVILALQEASKEGDNYRSKHLLTVIFRAISANTAFYDLTGKGIVDSPLEVSLEWFYKYVESDDAGLFNTQISEIVRNPATPEAFLEELHTYLLHLQSKEVLSYKVLKQPLRWIEAHPNWSKPATPAFSIVEEGEEEQYFIGYDAELMHPTMVDDLTSDVTPANMRLSEEELHASLTMEYTEEGEWEDNPALWNGTRAIAGHHALRHFTPEQIHDLVIDALVDPFSNSEERLCGLAPAFGAVLARLTEPYGESASQVPLEWILEVASSPRG